MKPAFSLRIELRALPAAEGAALLPGARGAREVDEDDAQDEADDDHAGALHEPLLLLDGLDVLGLLLELGVVLGELLKLFLSFLQGLLEV